MSALPAGFSNLERFVHGWASPDFQARFHKRYEADMPAIQDFYDAVLPRLQECLDAIDRQPLHALEGEWLTLYNLVMAFAHVALAVERHRQPRPAAATYPTSLLVVQAPLPS